MPREYQPDDELCQRYARFASHLDRRHFQIIYWLMFMTNLFVLFLASWTFIQAQEALQKYEEQPTKRRRRLRLYIGLCLGCVAISTVIVVMEAFALLALQFCDGEDLISIYWSTWTMIQVGSLIAMMGIILALMHSLRNRQHPPWALALGTPVLVIAGLLHLLHDFSTKRLKKMRRHRRDVDADMTPISQAATIRTSHEGDADESYKGELIGLTVEGGPIVRFNGPVASLPDHVEILGLYQGNRPVVSFQKTTTQLLTLAPP